MSPVPASDPPARPRCTVCELPARTCVCALALPIGNRVDVLVLQHPLEVREAKGSARLLRLSLAQCRVVVGEAFDDETLGPLLQAGGRRNVLLYPEETAAPGAGSPSLPELAPEACRLVVLDGTWRKSLRMLCANPLLQALPRLALRPATAGRYGALRKARHAGQLSTLEATCAALAQLEGDARRYEPLLRSFERFVDEGVARRPRLAS